MKTRFQLIPGIVVLLLPFLLSACGSNSANDRTQTTSPEPQQQAVPASDKPAAAPIQDAQPAAPTAAKETPLRRAPANRPVKTADRAEERRAPASPPAETTTDSPPVNDQPAAPRTPERADEVPPVRVDAPAQRQVAIPSGTAIAVRMVDSIDSKTAHVGETFKASLDQPIVVNGEIVFPKGSEAWVKLTGLQSAGRVSGRSELELQLDRIFLGDKSYVVETDAHTETGASQTARTARSAGIGAAIGAAIGAISGGGKGAAIGGVTGAGAGAGVEAIRNAGQVRVESEALLNFRLADSVEVTLRTTGSSPTSYQRNHPSGPDRLGTRQ